MTFMQSGAGLRPPPPPPPPPPIEETSSNEWMKWLLPLVGLLLLAVGMWFFTRDDDPNTVEVTVTPIRMVIVSVTPEPTEEFAE